MSRVASFEIICPCCGSKLTIDSSLGAVVHSTPPAKQTHIEERDLEHASQLLEKDAAQRDTLFRKSLEAQKSKSELLDRKFEEALKKGREGPATPPLRDIDLD
ncbi:MAG: hypothetical protein ACRD19_03600 [Terriglobia bacterium]